MCKRSNFERFSLKLDIPALVTDTGGSKGKNSLLPLTSFVPGQNDGFEKVKGRGSIIPHPMKKRVALIMKNMLSVEDYDAETSAINKEARINNYFKNSIAHP